MNLTQNSSALLRPTSKDYLFWGIPTLPPCEASESGASTNIPGVEESKNSPIKNGQYPIVKKNSKNMDHAKYAAIN